MSAMRWTLTEMLAFTTLKSAAICLIAGGGLAIIICLGIIAKYRRKKRNW